jgi:ankyrin repeat protein
MPVASWFARARKCLAVAAWTAGTLVASPAQPHEAEQYTLPIGRDFADLGPYFTKIAYDSIAGAVAETNAAIRQSIESNESDRQTETLQSADYIAGKVWEHFFVAIPTNELLDATLISESVQSRYPGLVTMYRPVASIYDDPLLVIDLTKAVRTFFRAGTVSANGLEFGSDKIIHFINVGRIYHSKYETRIKRGLPPDEAAKSAIASTSRNPLTSEDGLLGMLTTGIHSNGDLAADYAGLLFYRNLTEPVAIGSRALPPMLVRDGPYWRLQVKPDSDFFVVFITPHWNEVLNPNRFARYTSGRMRTLVGERCADALDHYRDMHGRLRQRAEFEAIERELSTYYGFDYDHESNKKHPVTIAAVCFPETPKATALPGDSTAATVGPDALGRTQLWWAAREGNEAQVRRLASAAELNAPELDGETPLHAAVRAGSPSTAREMLAGGAAPDAAALYDVTPLLLAARRGDDDMALVLLKAGADPNRRDLFGTSPLHAAARRDDSALALRLLERGADPRAIDVSGNTPLHLAARWGSESVVAILMKRGANANVRNAAGATPRDEALRSGHASIAEHLMRQPARASIPAPQASNAGHSDMAPSAPEAQADQ